MASIAIKDLEVRKELDSKTMMRIFGGAFKTFPQVPSGWTLVSTATQRTMNLRQVLDKSKDIPGAFEFKTKFQDVTTVTLQHTEFVAG